jgi:O-antigen/teichoic acid export membrane protein
MAFVAASALATRTVGNPLPAFDLPFWYDLQRRALPFGAFVIVLQLYNYVDTVMLGVMRGDAETGLYSAAYRLYEGLAHVPSIITVVLMPRLAREFVTDPKRHRRIAAGGMAIAVGLGIPAAFVTYGWAAVPFDLLYDAAFAPAAEVLQILGAGFVVVYPLAVLHAVAISANAERLLLLTALVGCSVNVAANLVLIPSYGMYGAAVATVGGEIVSLLVLGTGLWHRAAPQHHSRSG